MALYCFKENGMFTAETKDVFFGGVCSQLKGRAKSEDKHGNDSVNALAREGAALYALPRLEVHTVKHRSTVTETVQ